MRNLRFALGILACASGSATAGIVDFFVNHQQFTGFVQTHGKFLKDIENFEESTAAPNSKTPFPNSLQNGVPRPTFPNGIDATNLIIQTNVTPGPTPPVPNPSLSPNALWVNGAGFINSNSIKIGTDEFLNQQFSSLDLIFPNHDKTAVGVDLSTFQGFNQGHSGWVISVYSSANALLGTFAINGATLVEPSKTFVGMFSTVTIGRVNVWAGFDVPQPFAVDNIEMWVPGPGVLGVLGMGLVVVGRRRR